MSLPSLGWSDSPIPPRPPALPEAGEAEMQVWRDYVAGCPGFRDTSQGLDPISQYKLRYMTRFSTRLSHCVCSAENKGAIAKHPEREMKIRAPENLRVSIPENPYCLECYMGRFV